MIDMLHKIALKVWSEEKSPMDWSRMIALLSMPGKVFQHVLLQGIKQGSEKWLKE